MATNDLLFEFIKSPSITDVSPKSGFVGTSFVITGENLEDVTKVFFIDAFERKTQASFNKSTQYGNTVITGYVPSIDNTTGQHLIRVENESGTGDFCCFTPFTTTQTNIPNISGDVTTQNDDRFAINSVIDNAITSSQGFQVLSLSYSPRMGNNKLLIQCELSLQSSFFGGAVVALFKDNETTPKKVWNYMLMGLNLGQVARLGYVAPAVGTAQQTWKVKIGRPNNTYATVYYNRNSQTGSPYGGAASSWMSITEIQS